MRNKAALITGVISLVVLLGLVMLNSLRHPVAAEQFKPKPAPPSAAPRVEGPAVSAAPPPPPAVPPQAAAPAKPKVLGHVAGWDLRQIKQLVEDRDAHRKKLEEAVKLWQRKNPDAKALLGLSDEIEKWVGKTAKENHLAPRCFILDLTPQGREKCAANHDLVWGLDETGDILGDSK